MDIVTHALIGATSAAGLLAWQPELACGVVLGNVAPDLDAFSRLGGKQAFIRFHQTYTHSVAAVALVGLASAGLWIASQTEWSLLLVGIAIGMVMHVGLDLTNSYGVRWAWPFQRSRMALDWIFFIDLPMLLWTLIGLSLVTWAWGNGLWLAWISGGYVAGLLLMITVRGMIAMRARRLAVSLSKAANDRQATRISVIPTTWLPWRFLVCRDWGDACLTSTLNVWQGEEQDVQRIPLHDDAMPAAIEELPPWQAMRELSTFYHAVEKEVENGQTTFVCRDLRIRNYATRFGTLTCQVDAAGQIVRSEWEV
ncbi:metal-dependent hydrolase [Bremerella sp. JC817]|uniref:metal-dependent hydrolase n=1 Tax=Bremerella sp. JC817 TaxID=3231756 RepID=UPI00345AEE9D